MKSFYVGLGFILGALIIYSQIPYPERKNKYNFLFDDINVEKDHD